MGVCHAGQVPNFEVVHFDHDTFYFCTGRIGGLVCDWQYNGCGTCVCV